MQVVEILPHGIHRPVYPTLVINVTAGTWQHTVVLGNKKSWHWLGFHGMFCPDSKVHMVNMGPTWVLSAPGGPHVGPMNLAIRAVIAQWLPRSISICLEINWVPNNKFIISKVCIHWLCFICDAPQILDELTWSMPSDGKQVTYLEKRKPYLSHHEINVTGLDRLQFVLNNFIMVRVSYDSWLID